MASETDNNEESPAAKAGDDAMLRTNARLRQKYYIDENQVMSSIHATTPAVKTNFSKVINGNQAFASRPPVTLRCNQAPPKGEIQVEVVRREQIVSGIRINCPCGRHAELNFEYQQDRK